MKYDAIVNAGISVKERHEMYVKPSPSLRQESSRMFACSPAELVPADGQVEIDAKVRYVP